MNFFTGWRSGFLALCLCIGAVCGGLRHAAGNPNVYEPALDPAVGFNLIAWNTTANSTAWQNAVQSLYDNGFREVSISPVRLVNVSTGNITHLKLSIVNCRRCRRSCAPSNLA